MPQCVEKWIIEFTRGTIMGAKYNEGERAAFTVPEAKLLCEGGKLDEGTDHEQRIKPSAKVIRKLSAKEVEEIEHPATTELIIDTKGMSPKKVAAIKQMVSQPSAD